MVLSQQQEQESSNVHVAQPVTADKAEEEADGMTAASDTTTSDSKWKMNSNMQSWCVVFNSMLYLYCCRLNRHSKAAHRSDTEEHERARND